MNFYRLISKAIREVEEKGFYSQEFIDKWIHDLRNAATRSLIPEPKLLDNLKRFMYKIYKNLIEKEQILKVHEGVSRFTLQRVKPQLRAELDRRIMASASLIKMNRQAMINKTLQRFAGWATSIPAGGSKAVDNKEVKDHIRKALEDLPFEERRVMIDQGHKFTSELDNILSVSAGAIAAEWHSHWRQPGYNYRKDHKERDKKIYLIRGNWAQEQGLVKAGEAGYTEDITKPAEEPFCRCKYKYLYNLSDLPADMLTKKGSEKLWKARAINA